MTNDDEQEQEPMFASIEEAASTFGWDDDTVARIKAAMERTALYPPDGEPRH